MRNDSQNGAAVLLAILLAGVGCSSAEEEKEPVVRVEVSPAEKTSIAQTVIADAVLFPLRQATVAPKITSAIVEFKIRRCFFCLLSYFSSSTRSPRHRQFWRPRCCPPPADFLPC